MTCWEVATAGDRKLFEIISDLFSARPDLVEFLFDPLLPKLNGSSREILARARSLDVSGLLLIRVALDFWSGSGKVTVDEILDADPDLSRLILTTMARLVA